MTLTARITGKIKIPKLDFSDTLLEVGKKDFIARLAKNIQKGIDLQEQSYPKLAASTIKKKGHGRPLIDEGRLHSSFTARKTGKNRGLIRIKAARRKIARYLQFDGIKTKAGKRRFNFFGVSTRMEKAGIRRMEKEIKTRCASAGR